jgi:hypothetical protein
MQLIGPPEGSFKGFFPDSGAAVSFLDLFQMHGLAEVPGENVEADIAAPAAQGQASLEAMASPAGLAEAPINPIHASEPRPARDKKEDNASVETALQIAFPAAAFEHNVRVPALAADCIPGCAEWDATPAFPDAATPSDAEPAVTTDAVVGPGASALEYQGQVAGVAPRALWRIGSDLEPNVVLERTSPAGQGSPLLLRKTEDEHIETLDRFEMLRAPEDGSSTERAKAKAGRGPIVENTFDWQSGGARACGLFTPLDEAGGGKDIATAGPAAIAFLRKSPGLAGSGVNATEARGPVSAAVRMVEASRFGTHWQRGGGPRSVGVPQLALGRVAESAVPGGMDTARTASPILRPSIWSRSQVLHPVPLPATPEEAMAGFVKEAGKAVEERPRAGWSPIISDEPGAEQSLNGVLPEKNPSAGDATAPEGISRPKPAAPGLNPAFPFHEARSHAETAPSFLTPAEMQAKSDPADPALGTGNGREGQQMEAPLLTDEPPGTPEPLRELRVKLQGEAGKPVEVRFVQSSKDLRVVFRTPDAGLSRTLSDAVPELAGALEQKGWETEGWQGFESGRRAAGPDTDAPGWLSKPEDPLNRADHRHGGQGEGGQHRRQSHAAPDWLEEIERGVDGGLNAAAFRAGGHS